MNSTAVISAATSKLISSLMPSINAAKNPIKAQVKGIINKAPGNFLSVHKSKPNVKIVVGHGRPNVGDEG